MIYRSACVYMCVHTQVVLLFLHVDIPAVCTDFIPALSV